MKPLLIVLSVLYAGILFAGCKKSAKSPAPAESNWTWSLSNTKFVGTSTNYADLILKSYDDPDLPVNFLFIFFSSDPDSNSTYSVIGGNPLWNPTPTCDIEFFANSHLQFESSGGGVVNITIVGGKIHAAFADVPMGVLAGSNANGPFYNPDGTLSGTIIEQ